MRKNELLRGVSGRFAETFRHSGLYRFYAAHRNELFLGVRNGYVNLYYHCDSVAKIRCGRGTVSCEIARYYLEGKSGCSKEDGETKYVKITSEELERRYDSIKKNSDRRGTAEKKAQAQLVVRNNANRHSDWFCVDVEYKKQFRNREEREVSGFNGRFDILAVSKSFPHRVAIIELKYGGSAIGGESGIVKHAEDFRTFCSQGYYDGLKEELASILNSQIGLGVQVPCELHGLDRDSFEDRPEFYFIVLDNNAERRGQSTPKQTLGGYLFNERNENFRRWNCRRKSVRCLEDIRENGEYKYGDITRKDNENFHAVFLFSEAVLPDLGIDDIIDDERYEREPAL